MLGYILTSLHHKKAETLNTPDEPYDHNYHRTTHGNHFEIDLRYADDITWASTAIHRTNHIKVTVPTGSHKHLPKTKCKGKGDHNGGIQKKSCKILGSLLDTEKDTNRWNILAVATYNTLKNIFNTRYNSIRIKVRAFNAYIASVFLYNSEIWTPTKNLKTTSTPFNADSLAAFSEYTGPKPSAMKNCMSEQRPNPGIPPSGDDA